MMKVMRSLGLHSTHPSGACLPRKNIPSAASSNAAARRAEVTHLSGDDDELPRYQVANIPVATINTTVTAALYPNHRSYREIEGFSRFCFETELEHRVQDCIGERVGGRWHIVLYLHSHFFTLLHESFVVCLACRSFEINDYAVYEQE